MFEGIWNNAVVHLLLTRLLRQRWWKWGVILNAWSLVCFTVHRIYFLWVSEIDSWRLIVERRSLFCVLVVIIGTWGIIFGFYSSKLVWVSLSLLKHIACISNRWRLSSSNKSRLLNPMNALITTNTTCIHFNRFNLSACSLYNLQRARYSNGWLVWNTFLINSCSHINNLRLASSHNASPTHIRYDCCSFSWSISFCWTYKDGAFLCLTAISLLLSFENHFRVFTRIVNALRLLLIFLTFFILFQRSEYIWSRWCICDFLVVFRQFRLNRCLLFFVTVCQSALARPIVFIHCSLKFVIYI